MQTGKMDQRILFQSLVETNVEGGLVQQWSDDSPPDVVWGYVLSQRGQETFESARTNARETIRVLVRYRGDVNDKWRLTWNGQIYSIKYIDRSQRRLGQLWITAEVVGAL